MTSIQREKFASFILRVGLAIVFLYAAVSSLLRPEDWIGYLPQFMREVASPHFLLGIFSVYEILLALWLSSPRRLLLR